MADQLLPCGFDMIDGIYQDGSIEETLQKRVNSSLGYTYWLENVSFIRNTIRRHR